MNVCGDGLLLFSRFGCSAEEIFIIINAPLSALESRLSHTVLVKKKLGMIAK